MSNRIVIVTAIADRWRIGRRFPAKTPVALKVADLDDGALERLEADPVLALAFEDAPAPEPPTDPAGRIVAIKAAIAKLGEDDRNKDGSPKMASLEAALGWKPEKAEIVEALQKP